MDCCLVYRAKRVGNVLFRNNDNFIYRALDRVDDIDGALFLLHAYWYFSQKEVYQNGKEATLCRRDWGA